jgi:hypothetical protein
LAFFGKPKDRQLGNIYAKEVNGEPYCFHYYLLDPMFGPYVRVYRGLEVDAKNLHIDCLGLGIIPAIRKGGWKRIGYLDPGNAKLGPCLYFEPPYPNEWFLVENGNRKRLGKELPKEYEHLEVFGTANYLVLEERLLTGVNRYSARKWLEYKSKYEK